MEYLKLVYVGFAFPHHENTMGGYHHIASSLKYDYCVDCQTLYNQFSAKSSSVLAKMIRGINRILWGQHIAPWYLLRVLWLSITNKNLCFHVIYGENLIDDLFCAVLVVTRWYVHFTNHSNGSKETFLVELPQAD